MKCVPCLALLVFSLSTGTATAQTNTNQQIILKDPTPREVDLEKKLGVAGAQPRPEASGKALAEYNRRRQELVARASTEVYRLAQTLHTAMPGHRPRSSWRSEREVLAAIHSLAVNIRAALGAPGDKAPKNSGQDGKSGVPLTASSSAAAHDKAEQDADRLFALAADLQGEALHSGPDVIPLRLMRDAEQIGALTLELQQQLQP